MQTIDFMEQLTGIGIKPFLWFAALAFPGLISMHVYRLLMPARPIEWKTAILEAFFYSAVNFAICIPIFAWFIFGHPENNLFWAIIAGYVTFLVGPVAWPSIWVWVVRRTQLTKKLQLPYPTAWDAFFDSREPCFVLITLKSGSKIGGYYGPGSYASSFPDVGELYLSAVYKVDAEGKFLDVVPDTKGLLIRKDEYNLIEFFNVPQRK